VGIRATEGRGQLDEAVELQARQEKPAIAFYAFLRFFCIRRRLRFPFVRGKIKLGCLTRCGDRTYEFSDLENIRAADRALSHMLKLKQQQMVVRGKNCLAAKMRKLSKKKRQRIGWRFKDWQHKWRNGFKEIHGKTMNFVTYSYE
jgi:hypothetical protein